MLYLELFIFLPLLAFFYQLYKYADTRKGMSRQKACLALGIAYSSTGTVFLVFRSLFFAMAGLVLFMLGLRLLAKGLDRKDKKIFIDRFEEDQE